MKHRYAIIIKGVQMSKYKKCISCRKKLSRTINIVDDHGTYICTICGSCFNIGMLSENGAERLVELIRREKTKCQNQKLPNRNHITE